MKISGSTFVGNSNRVKELTLTSDHLADELFLRELYRILESHDGSDIVITNYGGNPEKVGSFHFGVEMRETDESQSN